MDGKLLAFAVAICAVGLAQAQSGSDFRPSKGMKEFGLAVNWTSASGKSFYSSSADFAYYITPNLVGAAAVSLDRTSGVPETTRVFLGARYEFNSSGQFVPYLLAGFLERTGSSAVTTDEFGVGANYYFRDKAALFAEIGFYRFGGATRDTTSSLNVGLRIFFK